jgi:hypothetical protein
MRIDDCLTVSGRLRVKYLPIIVVTGGGFTQENILQLRTSTLLCLCSRSFPNLLETTSYRLAWYVMCLYGRELSGEFHYDS